MRPRSRSVHFLHTCEKRITVQWRLPKKNVFRPQEKSEFGIAQRFSICKYSKSASVSSTFWYWKHIANLLGKIISRCLLPADKLELWPHVCRVKSTFTLLLTNRFVSRATTANSTKCLVNWIPLRICVRSRNIPNPIFKGVWGRGACGCWWSGLSGCEVNFELLGGWRLVIQTGKLQPVFQWLEKPVLLALLSNLTWQVYFCSRDDMSISSRPRRGFLYALTRTHWDMSAFLHARMLACYPATCCHLLPPPATSAAAACFAKTRPGVARV